VNHTLLSDPTLIPPAETSFADVLGGTGVSSNSQRPLIGHPDAIFSVEEALREQMEAFRARALAENTRRAYAADWQDFTQWCAAQGRQALPAEVDTACLYFVDCAGRLSKATLERRIAAISRTHRDAGHSQSHRRGEVPPGDGRGAAQEDRSPGGQAAAGGQRPL
jgi:hypothetical protein